MKDMHMKLRSLLITALFVTTAVALPTRSALSQSDQQCTLKQVSEALNNLGCVVSGAFISADSLVATIQDACAPTADAETCHACFRKRGGKVGPALKALVKTKILPKSSLSQFRIGLVTAEEETCAPKEEEDPIEEDDDEYFTPPTNGGAFGGITRGRGGEGDTFERPERPERPEWPGRRR
jgi:hypothetical protein